MFNMSAAPSLADIAAVTGNRNNGGYGYGGFGEGWWVLIILFAMFGGWGGNWANGGNGGCQNAYDTQAVVQRAADTGTIISKLDGINAGICSLGYDQLNQMNGINNTIMQTGFGITREITNSRINDMQNANAISTQISDCCCKTQTGLMNVINQMDKNACALNNNVHQTGDAIIQNQNQGFQMLNNTIRDGFCNLEMREQQREIANLRQQLNDCNLNGALQGTAQYIVNQVRPTAEPAYIVSNPWGCCNSNTGNCCNSSCCNQMCA